MSNNAPTARTDDPAQIVSARYEGRKLEVSGPYRIYPSGLWYFRSGDSDPAPTWIPSGHLTETARVAASTDAGDRSLVGAVTHPLFVTGFGFVMATLTWLTSVFRSHLDPVSARALR
ncbi:hypothetical protein EV641_101157 [Rhodococcus sp. SMB37]|uniref:hypothetical protein n=1 Tax=Rhodococcus sp. SMB37 TaxID=2512213 RepID=UPI0006D047A6|nr:hypothetical protein [Rhodococcus sp. SMB37]TCN58062.1 hypothetical protein EV641_101157 [Rhodococcus sp. SMB37]